MSEKQKTGYRGAFALLAALLLAAILALSLSSCGIIHVGGPEAATTTNQTQNPETAPEAGGTSQVPAVSYPAVTLNRYLSPEIPSEAGTYAYVASAAAPSVVSIVTEAIVYDRFNGSYVESGAGSGVVCHVDRENNRTYIITNNHVVEGYSTVSVYKNDSTVEYPAEVLGTDWQTDIAVLAVEGTDFTVAQCGNSEQLMVGQQVAAVGNPLGTLGGTMTDGIVSALARELEVEGVTMTLIQHSAPVSPGNSGGGLFNLYGQLIGIVNAKSTGTGVEGLSYAIPIDLALERAEQIMHKGYVSGTPYLGITYSTSSSGVVVSDYLYNAELEATNQDTLKAGDILYTLDGVAISEVADVRKVLSSLKVGDSVTAVFYRPNRYNYLKVTVNLTVHEYVPEGLSAPESSGDIEFN